MLLAKLGHRFDDDISIFEVECYKIIANEISKMEESEMKKPKSRKR